MARNVWLLLAISIVSVGVRLISIRQPFIDQWSWRQSDVAAIARNYYEHGFHFGHPQIDWAGDAAGYVGTEFPVLPFAAALSYKLAGVQEWVGRIQAVLCFAAALPFFFLLTRRLFGETTAIWATFFYAFAPLGVVASRAFMPDIPSLSLAIIGLYFYVRWLDDQQAHDLLGAALLISFALLIKLPTALIGAPILYLTFAAVGRRGTGANDSPFGARRRTLEVLRATFRRPEIWIFGFVALVPSAIWYWHAYQIAQKYYPYHFFGAGGFRIESLGWYAKIAAQTATVSLTPVLTLAAVVGLFVAPRGKYRRAFHWWLGVMLLFIVAAGWGNRHQWYQLPLVPIAAVFGACACDWASGRLRNRNALRLTLAALLIVAFGASAFAYARPYFVPTATELRELGLELKATTPPDALVVAADEGDPTLLYYAERKGWHFPEKLGIFDGNPLDDAQLIANLDRLRSHNARYVVFYYGTRWWLDYYTGFAAHLAKVGAIKKDTPRARIYELRTR